MALKTVTVLVVLYKLLTRNLEVSIAASNKVKPKGAAILLLLYLYLLEALRSISELINGKWP